MKNVKGIFNNKPCNHAWRVYPVRVPGITERVCAHCGAYHAFDSSLNSDPAPYSAHGVATCPVCKQDIDKMFGLILTHLDGEKTCPGSLLKDGDVK